MRKKWFGLLLALCLLCGAACAENGAPLRVIDGWWAADAYRATYPNREIEAIEDVWDENYNSKVPEILRSGDWDAACVSTTDFSLSELNGLGLTLDLGAVEACAAVAENLYPSIRAGCGAGERLVALPAGFLGTRAYSYQLLGTDDRGNADAGGIALRERLGFAADDEPTTFAGVCELGLRYMALDRETRKGSVFLFSDAAPQGFSLLYNMILTYQTEATDADGRIDFDTPAFRAALGAADPLLAAFSADPKRTYDEAGSLRVVLCDNVGVSGYGAFPRVTEGDAIPAFMTVVIVNPNSPHLQEAVDYAIVASACGDATLPLLLYQNADYGALLAESYDRDIAAQKEQGEDESVIRELEKRKAAGDDTYFIPKRVIERYAAEIAPRLIFPRWHSFAMDDLIFDYLGGKLDADGFIWALNGAAALPR